MSFSFGQIIMNNVILNLVNCPYCFSITKCYSTNHTITQGLKNPRKRPMKIDVDSVLPSFKDTTSIVWTNFTSPLAVNTTGSPKPVRCCDFNTTRLQPYEENTTLSSGTNLDEKGFIMFVAFWDILYIWLCYLSSLTLFL